MKLWHVIVAVGFWIENICLVFVINLKKKYIFIQDSILRVRLVLIRIFDVAKYENGIKSGGTICWNSLDLSEISYL